jgi:hypothetical protein
MMLMPMLLTVYIYFFLKNKNEKKKLSKIFETVLLVASIGLSIGWFALLFIDKFDNVSYIFLKVFILFLLSGAFTYLLFKIKSQRIVIFAIIIIIARIGFDWFIWPLRAPQFEVHETNALKVAEITESDTEKKSAIDDAGAGGTGVWTC